MERPLHIWIYDAHHVIFVSRWLIIYLSKEQTSSSSMWHRPIFKSFPSKMPKIWKPPLAQQYYASITLSSVSLISNHLAMKDNDNTYWLGLGLTLASLVIFSFGLLFTHRLSSYFNEPSWVVPMVRTLAEVTLQGQLVDAQEATLM